MGTDHHVVEVGPAEIAGAFEENFLYMQPGLELADDDDLPRSG